MGTDPPAAGSTSRPLCPKLWALRSSTRNRIKGFTPLGNLVCVKRETSVLNVRSGRQEKTLSPGQHPLWGGWRGRGDTDLTLTLSVRQRSSSQSSLLQVQKPKGLDPELIYPPSLPQAPEDPKSLVGTEQGSVLPSVTIRGILSPVPGGSPDISFGSQAAQSLCELSESAITQRFEVPC